MHPAAHALLLRTSSSAAKRAIPRKAEWMFHIISAVFCIAKAVLDAEAALRAALWGGIPPVHPTGEGRQDHPRSPAALLAPLVVQHLCSGGAGIAASGSAVAREPSSFPAWLCSCWNVADWRSRKATSAL